MTRILLGPGVAVVAADAVPREVAALVTAGSAGLREIVTALLAEEVAFAVVAAIEGANRGVVARGARLVEAGGTEHSVADDAWVDHREVVIGAGPVTLEVPGVESVSLAPLAATAGATERAAPRVTRPEVDAEITPVLEPSVEDPREVAPAVAVDEHGDAPAEPSVEEDRDVVDASVEETDLATIVRPSVTASGRPAPGPPPQLNGVVTSELETPEPHASDDRTLHEVPLSRPSVSAEPPPVLEAVEQAAPPPPGPTPVARPSVITAVPGFAPITESAALGDEPAEPPSPAAVAGALADRGDHDGMTVVRAPKAPPPPTGPSGATSGTPSAVCADGHANPPGGRTCRVCHAQLDPGAATVLPRPVIARLAFSGVQVPDVAVDRSYIVGRSPSARTDQPGLQPGLVTVPNPDQSISGSHVELRVHGWTMDVVDLQSTNGSWITLPGQDEQRLRPDEPMVLPVGAEVRLSDTVSFVVELPR